MPAVHQYAVVTGVTPIKENIANEVEMDSDDRVRRGTLDGYAWNGSGARRQAHRGHDYPQLAGLGQRFDDPRAGAVA